MRKKKSLKGLVAGAVVASAVLTSGVAAFADTQTIPFTITVQEAGKGFTINNNGANNIKMIQDTTSAFNLQGRAYDTYRNAEKVGVTITNDQNGGNAGNIFATLTTTDAKLTETTGKAPTANQVSVLTKNIAGSEVELQQGTEVDLGSLAGNATTELPFDIFLPADVIDQTDRAGVTGFKSETYDFVVTYTMK